MRLGEIVRCDNSFGGFSAPLACPVSDCVEVTGEFLVAVNPKLLLVLNPLRGERKPLRIEATRSRLCDTRLCGQSGFLEHLEMTRAA